MVDLSTISTIVVTVSVVIGVVFTLLELRHLARTRRTDVIMRIYERFGSREWVENTMKVTGAKFETFDNYRKKYGFTEVLQIAALFDGVGVLLEQDLIDIDLVDSLFGASVNLMWEATRPVIHGIRESGNQPLLFSHFEYLYERLRTYKKTKAKSRNLISK
jgi:hypothetical protein